MISNRSLAFLFAGLLLCALPTCQSAPSGAGLSPPPVELTPELLAKVKAAKDVGFAQQGPMPLDPKLVTLLGGLVELACSPKYPKADRLAALEAIGAFHDHATPWVHRLARLLDDPSPEIRRSVGWNLRECGPIGAVYLDSMLAQYDIAGSREDANKAAWIMRDMRWALPKPAILVLGHMRSPQDPAPLSYITPWMPATPEVIEALLAVPPKPSHLGWDTSSWIAKNASGDRRFIKPLLAALNEDWHGEAIQKKKVAEFKAKVESAHKAEAEPAYKAEAEPEVEIEYGARETCSETPYLTEALAAVGRHDKDLADTLTGLLGKPIPPDARLYVGWTLSQITDDPKYLVDALIWLFDHQQQHAASSTEYHIFKLLAKVDPSQANRLKPYREQLDALVPKKGLTDPAGYFLLTGAAGPVLEWARNDLEQSSRTTIVSYLLEFAVFELGPVANPLTGQMSDMLENGSNWNKHHVCQAFVALGPSPLTCGQAARLLDLAEKFKPVSRVAPAMALWSCCHKTDAALAILLPLLDDQGFATTHASWALGQMGRDARAALPRLRQLAAGSNPAYAKWAAEAVQVIETELTREITPDQTYQELGSGEHLVSIRALWRLVALGRPAATAIQERLEQEQSLQLPGVKLRQLARAAQVLTILEGPGRD
jgi:hypothetical protein